MAYEPLVLTSVSIRHYHQLISNPLDFCAKLSKACPTMNKFRWIAILIFSLIIASSILAKFCPKYRPIGYIQAIGECPQCMGFTISPAHKRCGKYRAKENKCQNWLVAFDANTGKEPQKLLKGPSGKPYPPHRGAPPLRQTRDLRPLLDGYGRGSSTLGGWIQENLDKDAAGGKASGKHHPVSRAFAVKHPTGSYLEGELLVGMKKGLDKDTCKKALADAIPGLEIKKSMFENTILHLILPSSVNVEQAISKLKAVKTVKYSEINGRVGIQPAPRPVQNQPRPKPIEIQPTPLELVAPPELRPGVGGSVDKAKVAQLEKSLITWETLKKECGGNYTYSKRWSSWVGFGHTTEVVVENNKVVERRYKSFSGRPTPLAPGLPPAKPEGTSWTEKGNELGKNKQGHPAKKLDELYKEAAEILGRPVPPFQRLGLRFDKQGLLLACYTQDTRIADDAPTKGVSISSITLQKPGKLKKTKVASAITEGTLLGPSEGSKQKKMQALEQKIAKMKDFAKRARFTSEGHRKFLSELSGLEKQLADLKSGKAGIPTYEKWLADGKKLPSGMVFTGGSPWFNESTGQRRQPRDVYEMIFGRAGVGKKPRAKLLPIPPRPIKPDAKKSYPKHWGKPPLKQTHDLRPLPGGFGMGSSTLANWIKHKMEQDRNRGNAPD